MPRGVCRLAFYDEQGKPDPEIETGTGFLIGRSIILTNHHVLNGKDLSRVKAQFHYTDEYMSIKGKYFTADLDHERLYIPGPDNDLDFAVVAIKKDGKNTAQLEAIEDAVFRILQPKNPETGERVHIIQHPQMTNKETGYQDAPKRVSVGHITSTDHEVSKNEIHYTAEATFGGSGGAVINDGGELVALHHKGCKESCNLGVSISKIIDHIQVNDNKNHTNHWEVIKEDSKNLSGKIDLNKLKKIFSRYYLLNSPEIQKIRESHFVELFVSKKIKGRFKQKGDTTRTAAYRFIEIADPLREFVLPPSNPSVSELGGFCWECFGAARHRRAIAVCSQFIQQREDKSLGRRLPRSLECGNG